MASALLLRLDELEFEAAAQRARIAELEDHLARAVEHAANGWPANE